MSSVLVATRLAAWLRARPRTVERGVLVVIAVACLQPKLSNLGTWGTGPDGSLYMDVAQHLLSGDGLVTSQSLYHQGYRELPHPTSVQPLWPLLLAASATIMPLTTAAILVPSLLWALALALAYWWGRRVAPNILPSWRGRAAPDHMLHGGHVALALLGLSPHFERFTSRPYTEGLSFALLFALLLRAPRLVERRSTGAGIELGVWLALLFYARSQHLVVVLAAVCLLGWLMVREPRRRGQTLRFAMASALSFSVAFLPELLWVGSFVEGNPLLAYLRFDQSGEASALSDVRGLRAGSTMLETLLDRLNGIPVAFGPEGYSKVFGYLSYIAPIALLALLVAPKERWRDVCELIDRHGLAFITALGALLLLHVMHKDVGNEWWFGDRHALLGVLFFSFAFFLCARAGGVFGWLALALFIISTLYAAVDGWVIRWRGPVRVLEYRLEAQARLLALDVSTPGQLIVAIPSTEARQLAWLVPEVGFQAMVDQTTFDDLVYMVDELGVDYVVTVGAHDVQPTNDARFEESFELIDEFSSPRRRRGKGKQVKNQDLMRIYAPRFAAGRELGPAG